jgi:hypothetical protein
MKQLRSRLNITAVRDHFYWAIHVISTRLRETP